MKKSASAKSMFAHFEEDEPARRPSTMSYGREGWSDDQNYVGPDGVVVYCRGRRTRQTLQHMTFCGDLICGA